MVIGTCVIRISSARINPRCFLQTKRTSLLSGESVGALIGRGLEPWLGDEAEEARSLADFERRWAAVAAGEDIVCRAAVMEWLESRGTTRFHA
ncbi:MAG: hypothetical protein MI723_01020 [Caulobacterales bacterium]|nr:hypothetical protein [Caulobacterales bacterium]